MKRVLLSLCLASIALTGCSSSPTWDKAAMENKVKETYTQQLRDKGEKGECTEVKLVSDGENKFTGYANFSDGTQKDVVVTIDPVTKEAIF